MGKLTKAEILEKAKSILSKDEKRYQQTCFEAKICPECGGNLKSEFVKTSMSIGKRYYCCNFTKNELRTRPSLT